MALTRLGPNQLINLATNTTGNLDLTSQVTGTLPTGNGGTGSTTFSPGKILQTVTSTIDNSTETTTSQSFVTSSLQLNITPSATSSKILIFVIGGQAYVDVNAERMHTTIYRDSTNLGNSVRGLANYSTNSARPSLPHSMLVEDSPSSTSQINYRCYYNSDSGGSVYFGTGSMGKMTMTAMEIGA